MRNDAIFARDNAWGHELEAVVLAAALGLGNFAAVSSCVHAMVATGAAAFYCGAVPAQQAGRGLSDHVCWSRGGTRDALRDRAVGRAASWS